MGEAWSASLLPRVAGSPGVPLKGWPDCSVLRRYTYGVGEACVGGSAPTEGEEQIAVEAGYAKW